MALKWTDTLDIAIELDEAHADADPIHVNFVDLRNWVTALDDFEDIRDLQKRLKANGASLVNEADEDSSGPASFLIHDPDGNPVLVDQHV